MAIPSLVRCILVVHIDGASPLTVGVFHCAPFDDPVQWEQAARRKPNGVWDDVRVSDRILVNLGASLVHALPTTSPACWHHVQRAPSVVEKLWDFIAWEG